MDINELTERGYENVQSVAARMDTKATLLNTVSFIMMAYLLALGKWWITMAKGLDRHDCWSMVGALIALAGIGVSIYSIYQTFRYTSKLWLPQHSLLTEDSFSVMFPEWDGRKIPKEFVEQHYSALQNGGRDAAQKEITKQSIVMGGIIYNKIENARLAKDKIKTAATCLLLLSVSPVVSAVYSLLRY
ncbi:hypothetical protein NT6N_00360 [Oceaniferula spumae]|uniref:Pycsar effector protein domain-containing protein n=1 Tax=Oceaniferula spumae TaxID=2979115 RepID=A0AAT9FG82_9BACT